MSNFHMRLQARRALPILLVLILAFATPAFGASINYGNFGPNLPAGITKYLSVTESSGTDPVPLFGPPSLAGNTLDFDPVSFSANAVAGGADITDGQLNFTLETLPLTGVTSLALAESGDYTLFGTGTVATQAAVGAIMHVTILEVDGSPLLNPIASNASVSSAYNLAANPGILQPWSLGLFFDFAALLQLNEVPFELGVTKAEIVLDNQLLTISEAGSISFIAKKDFRLTAGVVIDPDFVIPEPSSLATMGFAVLGLAILALRRRA